MQDEKDMIDINLDTRTTVTATTKENNYFGNIRFARAQKHAAAVPYDQYRNEDELRPAHCQQQQSGCGKSTLASRTPAQISCLRQLYCPDCQQRLDPQSVRYEKAKTMPCCLPIFPFSCIYKCCVKRHATRKVLCQKCGGNLGYLKSV